jgi:uncharacterized alpha-E superfamily protein
VHRLAGKLMSMLNYTDIHEILEGLHPYLKQVQALCAAIHDALYEQYIAYAIESAL